MKSPVIGTKRGSELKVGDVIRTCFGDQPIVQILPYTGPFDFVCGIACMPGRKSAMEMSIERDAIYELTLIA